MDSAQTPNGNGTNAECIRHKRRIQETAQEPNGNGTNAESFSIQILKEQIL
jgi:hypothetical protein